MNTPSTVPATPGTPCPRAGHRLGYGVAILALLLAGWLMWFWHYAHSPAAPGQQSLIDVTIPPATDFQTIRKLLTEAGVIRHGGHFSLLARIMGVTEQLKAGDYRFVPGKTPTMIIQKLEQGATIRWPVTIPEGYTLAQIANLLEEKGMARADRFLEKTRDQALIHELGLTVNDLEGYIFPDTFNLSRGMDESNVIRMMVDRQKAVLTKLYKQSGAELSSYADLPTIERQGVSLTPHDVLTLASIVERETSHPEERVKIAAVFLNRLRQGMRLQADPTVMYGLPDFTGSLRRDDLRCPTPYNTYLIPGLPPGPIANPGRAAIAAIVLPPDQLQEKFPDLDWEALDKYLYFVSQNNRTHYFSKNLAEHNSAVGRYYKKRDEAAAAAEKPCELPATP
jgi:UPF0755 protein